MQHYLNYVDGQWRDSSRHLTIMNPSNDTEYATIALATLEDADDAMKAARACVESGALSDVRPAAIREITDEASMILCLENGKNFQTAREEFEEAARYFEYYAGIADKIEGKSIPLGKNYVDFTQYIPMGISVQIVPWNFPVSICARSLAPALAAGNAVVVKSPEVSPLAMTLLFKAIEKADLPKGAVNLLCGKGSVVGAYLVKHSETNQIVFTGSVPTGQTILRDAATRAIPSVMELGGKSAAIALEDVNINVLLKSVKVGIFYNSGQVCSAMSRLLIHRSRYEEVKSAVVSLAEGLKIGHGGTDAELTPLVSKDQQQQVLKIIQAAREQGANILTGGKSPDLPGYFVLPTIIEATPNMDIAQQEVFGPVLVLMPFDHEEEAISIANGTEFGLVSGVFGESINQTLRVANRMISGQVFINEWFAGGIETPFGGIGLSGFGREKGQEAIYSYVQTRNIGIKLMH